MGTVGAVFSGLVGGVALVILTILCYKLMKERMAKRKNYQNANHLDQVGIETQEMKEAI